MKTTDQGKLTTRLITLMAISMLAGCATTGEYDRYLAAQAEANRQAQADQKPLVELIAHDGQSISGLAGLKVYLPVQAQVVQQARPNEWASIAGKALDVTGSVLGLHVGGKAAIGLAGEIRQAGTAAYPFVQNPLTQPAPLIVTQPAPVIVKPEVVRPDVVRPEVVGGAR